MNSKWGLLFVFLVIVVVWWLVAAIPVYIELMVGLHGEIKQNQIEVGAPEYQAHNTANMVVTIIIILLTLLVMCIVAL